MEDRGRKFGLWLVEGRENPSASPWKTQISTASLLSSSLLSSPLSLPAVTTQHHPAPPPLLPISVSEGIKYSGSGKSLGHLRWLSRPRPKTGVGEQEGR